jgi:ABC-type amino acid transport system permease subunit
MIEDLKNTADELARDGRLDKKLKNRLRFFEILSFVFGLITVYDIIFEGFYWFHVFLVVAVSFLFGFFALAKINQVKWDKKRKIVIIEKMDIFGIVILVLYITARILSDVYLHDYFDGNVSKVLAYTFFTIFGIALGRFAGTVVSIHHAEPNYRRKWRFTRKNKKGV